MNLVNSIITSITSGFMFFVQVFLYLFFWLADPLPIGGRAAKLMRRYIKKKFIVCLGYSLSVGVLLMFARVNLKTFIVCASFFLSFIPEIGPMIAALLPMPVIIFDSTQKNHLVTLGIVLVGELALKLFWSNYVELRLVQQDVELAIHPVWIITGLMYFGYLFGPIGMIFSVPVLALIKGAVMESVLGIPKAITEPFIACLEGRKRELEGSKRIIRSSPADSDSEGV